MTEILIPELEEYRETGVIHLGYGTKWSGKEEAILEKYYGYAPIDALIKHLPGRSKYQIMSKASRMGLSNRGKQ